MDPYFATPFGKALYCEEPLLCAVASTEALVLRLAGARLIGAGFDLDAVEIAVTSAVVVAAARDAAADGLAADLFFGHMFSP